MKRGCILFFMLLCISLCAPIAANAEIIDSGECGDEGDNVIWELDNEGTLTISGSGGIRFYINDSQFGGESPFYY